MTQEVSWVKTKQILQSTSAPLVQRPLLTEALLRKPPLRFLVDVIQQVSDNTGFGRAKLPRLDAQGTLGKEAKLAYLELVGSPCLCCSKLKRSLRLSLDTRAGLRPRASGDRQGSPCEGLQGTGAALRTAQTEFETRQRASRPGYRWSGARADEPLSASPGRSGSAHAAVRPQLSLRVLGPGQPTLLLTWNAACCRSRRSSTAEVQDGLLSQSGPRLSRTSLAGELRRTARAQHAAECSTRVVPQAAVADDVTATLLNVWRARRGPISAQAALQGAGRGGDPPWPRPTWPPQRRERPASAPSSSRPARCSSSPPRSSVHLLLAQMPDRACMQGADAAKQRLLAQAQRVRDVRADTEKWRGVCEDLEVCQLSVRQ